MTTEDQRQTMIEQIVDTVKDCQTQGSLRHIRVYLRHHGTVDFALALCKALTGVDHRELGAAKAAVDHYLKTQVSGSTLAIHRTGAEPTLIESYRPMLLVIEN